ncbi:MmcB family DNA repair protein [Sneathiella glossodoripedis]|uniref:MmcB family DNA repair protein n=1 Tax=Sneathiella glossodoripedis TaxID=418853 RepID=UPI000B14BC44|nr:MmcB family DNA repair protein [Sneathiella glossodoripedis]
MERSDKGVRLARSVQNLFEQMGYASMCEVNLRIRRRVDVMGINDKGHILIAEIKSSVADFRSDGKWAEYLDFCDGYFFAVDEDFPTDLLPQDQGLIIADDFHAEIIRPAPDSKLNAARRKNITLRFARQAAYRLSQSSSEPSGL